MSAIDNKKLEALAAHIADDKYCHHLVKNGMMETCKDPTKPIDVVPPPSTETIKYDSKNYVHALTTDPRYLWDYSGHSYSNRRYCHGMVAATWSYEKGQKYNQHLMNGEYRCDSSMVKGLANPEGNSVPSCYCNPNYEWTDYTMKKPARSWGLTASVPYEGQWIKQAELGEARNCDGLVAIVDIFRNWVEKSQWAIVKENKGPYTCSYDYWGLYDWADSKQSYWGGQWCFCNPKK